VAAQEWANLHAVDLPQVEKDTLMDRETAILFELVKEL
jgi:hypothetical protein